MMTKIERTISFSGDRKLTLDYGVSAPKKQQSKLDQQKATVAAIRKNSGLFDLNGDGRLTKAEIEAARKDLTRLQKEYKQLKGVTDKAMGDIANYFDPLMYGKIETGSKAFFQLSLNKDGEGKDDFSAMEAGFRQGNDLAKQANRRTRDVVGTNYAKQSDQKAAEAFREQLGRIRSDILQKDDSGTGLYDPPNLEGNDVYTGADNFLRQMEGGVAELYDKTGWPDTDKSDSDKETKVKGKNGPVKFTVSIGGDSDIEDKADNATTQAQHAAWRLPVESKKSSEWDIVPVESDESTAKTETATESSPASTATADETESDSKDNTTVAFALSDNPEMRFKGWNEYQAQTQPKAPERLPGYNEMVADASFSPDKRSDWTIQPT